MEAILTSINSGTPSSILLRESPLTMSSTASVCASQEGKKEANDSLRQPGRNTSTVDQFQEERKRRGPIVWMLVLAGLGVLGFFLDLFTI